jgi:hypothetical protein
MRPSRQQFDNWGLVTRGLPIVALSTASTIKEKWTSSGPSGGCIQFTGVQRSNTGQIQLIDWSYENTLVSVNNKIHSDMRGKLPISFPDRYQYITTFSDDNSRHIRVAFMQRKSQLPQAFTVFHRELQVVTKRKLEMGEIHTSNNDDFKIEDAGIRILRVHREGGKGVQNLERLEGYLATYSAPYTPENSPISERGNRT